MDGDQAILERVQEVFRVPRPEHFTQYTHCDECWEHDETLRTHDLDTLTQNELGAGSWDPITMTTAEGFNYYLPALARLVLGPDDPYWGWYGDSFIFHMAGEGPFNRRWAACTAQQRRAVHELLVHILETRPEKVEECYSTERLLQAIEVWSVYEDV